MAHIKRTLKLAFLIPNEKDPMFNKLVARISKYPMCHVELVFEDGMAFSIFKGSNLFFKPRTFSNPDYRLVSLSVSNAEYQSAHAFCTDAMACNLEFADTAMVCAYFQLPACPLFCTYPSTNYGSTFCSKIVTEALQFAGVSEVQHLQACLTTPSVLYDAVKDSDRGVMDSVPFKQQQLYNVGVLREGCFTTTACRA